MDCPDMNQMAAYLDATLGEDDVRAMQEHFRNCRMCALALAELRELLGLPPQDPGLVCTASIKSLPGADKNRRRQTRRTTSERSELRVATAAN